MSGLKIPHFGLARQYKNLREELLEATDNALRDGVLMNGFYTKIFEHWLTEKTKTLYAVTVHSGTQALEILASFLLSRIDTPNVVQIPNFTYPATLTAFLTTGWNAILKDTNSYGMMEEVEYNTSCCLVGLFGRKPTNKYCKMSDLTPVNGKTGAWTIVDGAQHWLVADGEVGTGMAISFDPTKNLPAPGNGGAIVTNNKGIYEFAINYRNNSSNVGFKTIGTNSRMSELDCAHLLVKTKYIDGWQDRRNRIAQHYCDILKSAPIMLLNDVENDVAHAHQKFVIYTTDRNALHTHLITSGIESKIHYNYVLGDLEIARTLSKPDMMSKSVMLSRGVLSLPIYPELTDAEVEHIALAVKKWYAAGPYK